MSKNADLSEAAKKTEYSKIVGGVAGAIGDWAGREAGGSKIVIENVLKIDGKKVARQVNKHNARDGRRQ